MQGRMVRTVITHPEKVLFPDDGITKGEVAAYYEAIAPVMLPYLSGRPLTMERYPAGIGHKGFWQKDVSKGFPDWLERVDVPKKEGVVHHPVVTDLRSLLWTANQNTITHHVWTSRAPDLQYPDICVFDLDPSTDDVASVRAAAIGLRDLLEELTLASWIKTTGSKATGVVLDSGEEIEADVVMSSLDSRWTFIKLLEDGVLDPSFREEVLRYKYRGSSGKVNLALDGLPELACKPGTGEWLRGAISFSPSIDYIERAYDDAKYGRPSARPYIDCIMPTLVDPTMAPPGKHVMSCFVQYAPYHLADGKVWDDAARESFGQNVIDTLEERFPDIRSKIVGHQFVTPKDIEDITGLTEGNIFQGELSLEQLFFNRPVPGWSRYRTPVRNLWMCGSATHPGGGIMGAPGRIAALEYVKEKKKGRRAA